MSLLGRVTNSILSGTNENNISLANLNFDFSLVNIDAPKEFQPLASALSKHRRQDAEEGQPHKTARKLGALFQDQIPSTPKLIEAFGERVSEIVQTPGVNPQGTTTHGPFERFVGADGTTLWAAATSGIPAIGVYLLSCLLARAWDAKHATALWVELIRQRQMEIEAACENNHIISPALFSARQEISRDDLARWDNSARSWLRSADQAKVFECDQLMLIRKNLELPVMAASSTYTSVMNVWREAMLGMEALLSGEPVMISNGSLFLAFSSWHLFPDLIVLGNQTTHIKLRDKLFPPGGSCTVCQEAVTRGQLGGIRWSLAFSHLRYYGDPVVVRSNQDYSRVTYQELKLAVLGSVFKEWRVSDRDHNAVAQWFLNLWTILEQIPRNGDGSRPRFRWLRLLVDAAEDFLKSKGPAKQKNTQLLRFGRRRAKLFLVDQSETLLPFFGICGPLQLAGLTQQSDLDCGIGFLRAMARGLNLEEGNAVICYAIDGYCHDKCISAKYFRVMTALPHRRQTKKRNSKGDSIFQEVHAQWFISRETAAGEGSTEAVDIQSLLLEHNRQGNICSYIPARFPVCDEVSSTFTWPVLPNLYYRHWVDAETCCSAMAGAPNTDLSTCNCFEVVANLVENSSSPSPSRFRLIYGDWRLGLYIQEPKRGLPDNNFDLQQRAINLAKEPVGISTGVQSFNRAKVTPSLVSDYLSFVMRCVDDKEGGHEARRRDLWLRKKAPGLSIVGNPSLPIGFCQSLFALELASIVYENLEGATISLKLLSEPFHDWSWLPRPLCKPLVAMQHSNGSAPPARILEPAKPVKLTRQQAFACVAKFESGYINLDPAHLQSTLALCSEDSMFVAAVVLSDPFDRPEPHKLRRIVGNISHPGISLLVAPEEPRIRNPTSQYNAVTHASYDFQRENNFTGTSLHLSFTDWRFPLEAGEYRTIDQEVLVVESVVSVLDRGKWVADLDILCIDFEGLTRIIKDCKEHEREAHDLEYDYTSIDNWDELLDGPEGVGIFRAHGNWAARLAAVSILSQKGQGHSMALFGTRDVCFRCLEAEKDGFSIDLMEHESPLPSFCID